MAEFAPARLAREAQGSFGNTRLPKPSCQAQWFWPLLPKQKWLACAAGETAVCISASAFHSSRQNVPRHVMNAVITKSNARITIDENTTVRVVEYATPSLVGGAV